MDIGSGSIDNDRLLVTLKPFRLPGTDEVESQFLKVQVQVYLL